MLLKILILVLACFPFVLDAQTNVCSRTGQVRVAIEKAVGIPCHEFDEHALTKVKYLQIGLLNIKSFKSFDFQGLTGLQNLIINWNPVKELPSGLFDDLSALTRLEMMLYSDLEKIPMDLFQNMTALKSLLFAMKAPVPGSLFQPLKNLKIINITQHRTDSLPKDLFQGLHQLSFVSITGQMKFLPQSLFQENQLLETVKITNTKITRLPEKFLQGLTELKKLDLKFNKISELPENLLRDNYKLDYVSFKSNNLKNLPENIFQGLLSLQHILLDENKIENLPDGIFQAIPDLKFLILSKNNISEISEYVFYPTYFSKEALVVLFGNPLTYETVLTLKDQLPGRLRLDH